MGFLNNKCTKNKIYVGNKMFPKGITLNIIYLIFCLSSLFFLCPSLFPKEQKSRELSEKQEGVVEISHIIGHHVGLACLTYTRNYLVFYQVPKAPEKGPMKEVQKRATKFLTSCEADLWGTMWDLSIMWVCLTIHLAQWMSVSLQRMWSLRKGKRCICAAGDNITVPAFYWFHF